MNIAILGATSQIAKDLIISFAQHANYHCILFSRSPESVQTWLQSLHHEHGYISKAYVDFDKGHYDAVINFVGVGNPARAKEMGSKIFDITYQYDQLALAYIKQKPACKYIFLSSGAVYGDIFSEPATASSVAEIPVNLLDETYWYTIAKLYAEARHRALPELSIVDVRVFNYFSHTQDMSARFLITDIVCAIRDKRVLKTSSENIVRDFLHPDDFYQLIECILKAGAINMPLDCYSNEPVDKMNFLRDLAQSFGLKYELVESAEKVNATGLKLRYYSENRLAEELGYEPQRTSIEGVMTEMLLLKSAE